MFDSGEKFDPKPGDIIAWYNPGAIEWLRGIGLVVYVNSCEELVNVVWSDGTIWEHKSKYFTVLNERY